MKPARITIITAALNPGPEVAQAIGSVFAQNYPNLQYIFVDGGSNAAAFSYVEPFLLRIDRLIREPDSGISDAWNKALTVADGDIVGIVSADDYLMPGALATVAHAFAANPGLTVVHGCGLRISSAGSGVRRPPYGLPLMLRIGTPLVHPATFVARCVYEQIGSFDTRYRIAMDYDLVLRAHRAGVRFVRVPAVLVGFRRGGLSEREPLLGFREVRDSQIANGLNRPLAEFLYAAKIAVRRYLRPGLARVARR